MAPLTLTESIEKLKKNLKEIDPSFEPKQQYDVIDAPTTIATYTDSWLVKCVIECTDFRVPGATIQRAKSTGLPFESYKDQFDRYPKTALQAAWNVADILSEIVAYTTEKPYSMRASILIFLGCIASNQQRYGINVLNSLNYLSHYLSDAVALECGLISMHDDPSLCNTARLATLTGNKPCYLLFDSDVYFVDAKRPPTKLKKTGLNLSIFPVVKDKKEPATKAKLDAITSSTGHTLNSIGTPYIIDETTLKISEAMVIFFADLKATKKHGITLINTLKLATNNILDVDIMSTQMEERIAWYKQYLLDRSQPPVVEDLDKTPPISGIVSGTTPDEGENTNPTNNGDDITPASEEIPAEDEARFYSETTIEIETDSTDDDDESLHSVTVLVPADNPLDTGIPAITSDTKHLDQHDDEKQPTVEETMEGAASSLQTGIKATADDDNSLSPVIDPIPIAPAVTETPKHNKNDKIEHETHHETNTNPAPAPEPDIDAPWCTNVKAVISSIKNNILKGQGVRLTRGSEASPKIQLLTKIDTWMDGASAKAWLTEDTNKTKLLYTIKAICSIRRNYDLGLYQAQSVYDFPTLLRDKGIETDVSSSVTLFTTETIKALCSVDINDETLLAVIENIKIVASIPKTNISPNE